jgi:hypothetical protein
VAGVRGWAPTDTYKVSISFQDGYKLVGQLTVAGPDAIAKAQACAEIVFARAAMDGVVIPPEDRLVELVGTGVCHQGIWPSVTDPPEVVLRIGARGKDRAALDRLGMEIIPLVTSGPPGVTGFAGGRPKASEIISYWPALIDKSLIQTRVTVETVS